MSNGKLTIKCLHELIDQLTLEDTKTFKQSIYDELYNVSYTLNEEFDIDEHVAVKASGEKEAIMKVISNKSRHVNNMLFSNFYIYSGSMRLRNLGHNKCIICKKKVEYSDLKDHMQGHTMDEKYEALDGQIYAQKLKILD